jgi:hypothetical protein
MQANRRVPSRRTPAAFDRLLRTRCAILPFSKRPERAILPANRPKSGECRLKAGAATGHVELRDGDLGGLE